MDSGIKEFAQFITDFGALILLAAILLYIIVRLVNIGFRYLENRMNMKTHDKLLDVRSNVGKTIQGLITQFLDAHDAERVHVVEFSNSMVSVAYLPFKYMNCTYEVYKLGNSSTASALDKLSTSLFVNFFAVMHEQGYVVVDVDHPDMSLGGSVYDLLKKQSEKNVLCANMKTPKGKSIGYVAFEQEDAFTDEDIKDLQLLADKVCTLLSVTDR